MYELPDRVKAIAGAVRHLDLGPDIECTYFAGSLTAGLGNATSDVDVFALHRNDVEEHATQHDVGGTRIDVEHRSASWLSGLVQRAVEQEYSLASPGLAYKSDLLDDISRFFYSSSLQDSVTYEAETQKLRKHESRLRRLLTAHWVLRMVAVHEDCEGALDSKDYPTAALMSIDFLQSALKAASAATGNLYYGRKWVFDQVRELSEKRLTAVSDLLWKSTDEDGLHQLVLDRISAAQAVLLWTQTRAWNSPLAIDSLCLGRSGGKGPRRSPVWVPICDQSIKIFRHAEYPQVKTSDQGLYLWAHADGRERDDLISLVASNCDVAEDDVANYLERLIDMGIVEV